MTTADPTPEPGPPLPTPGRPHRTLLVVLGVVLALVVVALIVVFTRGQPAQLDADTPGGVVQRYATAVLDGDDSVAGGYLTANAVEKCDPYMESSATEDMRITLVDVDERDRTADVRVAIVTSFDGGPFGSSEYESEDVFDLVKVDGGWLIERAPWQLTVCPATLDGENP